MGYVIKYENELRWFCWDFGSDWLITDKNTINEFKNILEDSSDFYLNDQNFLMGNIFII